MHLSPRNAKLHKVRDLSSFREKPFEMASELLQQLSGVEVSAAAIWQWVQGAGERTIKRLDEQLYEFEHPGRVQLETMDSETAAMPLMITADGVSVPFRPNGGNPTGKKVFQEVKVAVLARLGTRLNRQGKAVTDWQQRRVVAVLATLRHSAPLCLS